MKHNQSRADHSQWYGRRFKALDSIVLQYVAMEPAEYLREGIVRGILAHVRFCPVPECRSAVAQKLGNNGIHLED